jgi:hypothetical protein
VQFCVTHRLIQAHETWFFRLLLFCGMKMWSTWCILLDTLILVVRLI